MDRLEILRKIDDLEDNHCKPCELIKNLHVDKKVRYCRDKCRVGKELKGLGEQLLGIKKKPKREKGIDTMPNPALTKNVYQDFKAQGKTDKEIREIYNLNPNTLIKFKRDWEIGVRTYKTDASVQKPKADRKHEVTDSKNKRAALQQEALKRIIDEEDSSVKEFEQRKDTLKMVGEDGPVKIVTGEFSPIPVSQSKFHEVAGQIANLLAAKNHDYGNSFAKLYTEFGDLSVVIRLTDKLERYKTLINHQHLVKSESIDDTLRDIAGYAILTLVERGAKA
ncbi:zinc-finger domain-containing protein [Pullulanibacillus sp. KACC 23026]|uniref:zinc-finger domain-containing protein n=1 Tax=Pullulanibacillus sp. KACC 23026 TaxID=3028315 RepID=UPI0023AEB278|nr:zinc-finger domain-containing protein [Pullulanibacillus sp. KACC 23026]WEG14128.1 zinc-finger domain-containing protein [Pullulanibacillus sp. KACC 23026]